MTPLVAFRRVVCKQHLLSFSRTFRHQTCFSKVATRNYGLLQRQFLQQHQSISTAAPAATGLFSIPGLLHPHDFERLTKEAIQESDLLRESIPTLSTLTKSQAVETLYQLDLISKTVCNVIDAAELCRSAHASPQWREAANHAFHRLQEYISTLNGDQRLYQSLAVIASDPVLFQELTEEEQRFCILLKREFELDGIHLPDTERHEVQQLHNHVTNLETLFASNITNSQKQFWVHAQDVEQVLPKHVLQANGATYDDSEGSSKVQLTVDTPIAHSISSFSNNANLRKQVYMESMTSCSENLEVLDALIVSRQALAESLGFASYSHRFLQDKMAKKPEAVYQFLNDLQGQIHPTFQQEMTQLLQAKKHVEGSSSSSIEPWDIKFYVKLLKAQSGVDQNRLAPYLSLSNCLAAMQLLTEKLFGIEMKEEGLKDAERWDVVDSAVSKEEQIRKFVFKETESGRDLGTMYLDLHPRPGKYTHAAHFTVRCGCNVSSSSSDYQLPIVALVCNMNSGQASFSTHQEVETLFHEFGHALHSLLSRTKFQHLSGTRAAMDFVETPSHWMEQYVWDPQFLPILAQNTMTGESIPDSMIQALVYNRNQFRCLEIQNQIVLSLFDQEIFGNATTTQGQQQDKQKDTKAIWAALHRQHHVPFVDGSHWFTNVGHLVTYGGGYYGYLYSQVFANSIWNQLFHNRSLDRESGERIWKKMLIHGGSRDANLMLEDLLGHKPTVDNYWNTIKS